MFRGRCFKLEPRTSPRAVVVAEPLDDVVLRPVNRPLVRDADGRDARRLVGAGLVVQDRLAVAPARHKAHGVS